MKVLILGGTGAMGVHITEMLANKGVDVTVTTRRNRESKPNIKYIVGNAKDNEFIRCVCAEHWDAIIDFMVYTTELLKSRIDILLDATEQYIFISSARVYADLPEGKIVESSPRLLDVSTDMEYLSTDEYALAKAREENILFESERKNWTIIRPSLTYSENRLQLGVYEKENWLYRALHGRSIVFSKDLMDNYYTLSYGKDVAQGIADIVGNEDASGQAFHVVIEKSYKWSEILDIYLDELEKKTGKRPNVVITEKCTNLEIPSAKYQVLYGRYFNRHFDNSKIREFTDVSKWMDTEEGLRMCLDRFLKEPDFLNIDWVKEAYIDKAAREWTPIWEIPGKKAKIKYLLYRIGIKKAK